jgi:Helix-turn-helix domain
VGVDAAVGATLRKARNRRKIPLSEVEAAIKIRVRYLQAIEAEEWEALPSGSYARSFIRSYAAYLGLDGERLAADYERASQAGEREMGPDSKPLGSGRHRRPSSRAVTALVVLGLIGAAVAIGLATGGKSGGPGRATTPVPRGGVPSGVTFGSHAPKGHTGAVALALTTTAEVWVCVLDAGGHALVGGRVLPGGVEEGPFHSGSFTVAFGNGEVAMQVDGKEIEVPASASPLGYAIDSKGHLTSLTEAKRPTCL